MDKIEKLFRKISRKERTILRKRIEYLLSGETKSLNIKKIKLTNFYRLSIKNFRMIYHYENSDIIIDDVRLKNKKTYKNLK